LHVNLIMCLHYILQVQKEGNQNVSVVANSIGKCNNEFWVVPHLYREWKWQASWVPFNQSKQRLNTGSWSAKFSVKWHTTLNEDSSTADASAETTPLVRAFWIIWVCRIQWQLEFCLMLHHWVTVSWHCTGIQSPSEMSYHRTETSTTPLQKPQNLHLKNITSLNIGLELWLPLGGTHNENQPQCQVCMISTLHRAGLWPSIYLQVLRQLDDAVQQKIPEKYKCSK
jgi:hypothetical protein